MSIQAKPSTKIVPSSESLLAQVDSAMRRFDADREQALLREETRQNDRITRAMVNAEKSKARIRRWGC